MPDPVPTEQSPPRASGEPAAGRRVEDERSVLTAGLPARIGRYRVVALLGEGGFGRVYRGVDPDLNREVAIKVPLRLGLTTEGRERFLREARAAATVHHANVCPIYDVGTDGDLPFLVMRFVPGGTLAELLAGRKSRLPAQLAAAIARKLALGVAAAHEAGVIHRDLKPQNVLWDAARRQVLVTDFGLARVEGESAITPDRQVFGTPAYMSPEQAAGQNDRVGPLSDVWALGVILYELLTGHPPFQGTAFEVIWKVTQEAPLPPSAVRPGLDPGLESVCLTAMAREPADRYASAREMADALAPYTTDGPGAGREVVTAELAGPDDLEPGPDAAAELDSESVAHARPAIRERERVVCPACRTKLEVSAGRLRPVDCPICGARFAPEAGREAAREPTPRMDDARYATEPAPAVDRRPPPATRRGPDWTPAICGLLLSWLGLLFAVVSSCLGGVLALTSRFRDSSPPLAPIPGPELMSDESGVSLAVRLAPAIGLAIAAIGRWWAARVPHRVGGGAAARLAGFILTAAAGCVCYGVFAPSQTAGPSRHPLPAQPGSALAVGLLLGVFSEAVFTWYLRAAGRQLGPGYPRRRVTTLRSRLVYLLGVLAVGLIAVRLLIDGGHSDPLGIGLSAAAGVTGGFAVYLLVVSFYLSLSVHLRAVAEMWRDARGDD